MKSCSQTKFCISENEYNVRCLNLKKNLARVYRMSMIIETTHGFSTIKECFTIQRLTLLHPWQIQHRTSKYGGTSNKGRTCSQ